MPWATPYLLPPGTPGCNGAGCWHVSLWRARRCCLTALSRRDPQIPISVLHTHCLDDKQTRTSPSRVELSPVDTAENRHVLRNVTRSGSILSWHSLTLKALRESQAEQNIQRKFD